MTPVTPQYGSDSELQADVMRFMAIIAFCLIAILALVRNVEPAPPAATETPPLPPPEAPTAAAPPRPAVAQPEPETAPEPISLPEPVAVMPEPVPQEPVPDLPPAEPAAAAPAPAAVADSPPAAPSPPADDSGEDEGLILRFASDSDFLRLIARGDIKVYAYQDRDVLTLSESYQFLETRAPGQVYELLGASIPSLVMDALKQARADADRFRWGVALPGRISHQIESFVGQVRTGQLVIDRFGDVHHVAAS